MDWACGVTAENAVDRRVGTPWRVLISFDKDKNIFEGIRWNRILKDANPDK